MLYIKKLRWKNLLSTGNCFTELDFTKTKNSLIIGTNGAGKSTMLDALTFVLFNKSYRKINKPNLVNSINNSDCLVEIEFSIGKKEYKVVRGLKPNKFEIWVDEKMLNQDSVSSDQQKYLEQNILRLNYKSFTQIVILGSSNFVPFMQLPAAQRREIIEDLLDIKIFSSMNILLKDKIKEVSDQIKSSNYDVDILKEKAKIQNKLIKELSDNSNKNIQIKKESINKHKQSIEKLIEIINFDNSELEILNNMISEFDDPNQKLNKLENFKQTFVTKIRTLEKDNQFYLGHDTCPTCTQSISEEFKNQKILNNNELKNKNQEAIEKISKEIDDITIIIKKKTDLLKAISELNNKIINNQNQINNLNNLIFDIEKEISEIECNTNDIDKEKELLNELIEQGKSAQNKITELEKFQNENVIISTLLKDTGIKSKIIKKYLPIFNQLINKYLQSMDFYINFSLDENFNETIKSRYRDEFSYSSFSEGEKLRIDIALLFAWREVAKQKNSINTNLLILDEIFDSSLDTAGTDEFMKIIRELDKNTNILVISHKPDTILDKFERIISFEKIKNFSRMKEVL